MKRVIFLTLVCLLLVMFQGCGSLQVREKAFDPNVALEKWDPIHSWMVDLAHFLTLYENQTPYPGQGVIK